MVLSISKALQKKCLAIIPSIEGWHLLSRLLPTVDLPKEQIFIIDQGSRDGTEQKCREKGYGCIQMNARATFVEAVNRGIKEALERGAEYVLILNNDVEFKTHVASQLLIRSEEEIDLGVIAPRQVTVLDNENLHDVKRGKWNLATVTFSHDHEINQQNPLLNKKHTGYPHRLNDSQECDFEQIHPELLEADFCEFTCVLIKSSVFSKVGLLNEKYEFYHEDAEFCYRCQAAGYRCAYDQTALIRHFFGSTFDKQKTYNKFKLIKRNKNYFAKDLLHFHVRFPFTPSTIACSWSTTNEFLWTYLTKYGLITSSSDAPTLSSIAHPEHVHTDYLLSVWETSKLPSSWLTEAKKFKHIFVPSHWNKEVFESSGLKNVSVLPFGVETDLFHPWGGKLAFPWAKSILSVFQNQYRKGLDVTLAMWKQIRSTHPDVFLVMFGKGIELSQLGAEKQFALRLGNFIVSINWDLQMALIQPAFREYVSHADMAMLYRSCDLFLLNSRSEGFGYPILEAMACSKVCVIPNYGAAKEFTKEDNCLHFEGTPIKADYSDKGFTDVGEWWEPNLKDLSLKMQQAISLNTNEMSAMGKLARQSVLSRYTWRQSMMAFRRELEKIQTPSSCIPVGTPKSNKYQKQIASLLNSVGHNFVRAGIIMEQYGLKGVAKKATLKLLRQYRKKIRKKAVD